MANLFWLNVTTADNVAVEGNQQIISINDQKGFLESIRNATEEEINTSTKPRSIPDPWARAYLFGTYVLPDEEGRNLSVVQQEQKAQMIGAWRGFLAMLALSQVYDTKIEVKPVESCDGLGESLWRNRPETSERNRIHPEITDKKAGYLIYANTKAIGFTDAGFLAVPGTCKGRFDATYPWSDGIEFTDPTHMLSRGEKMIVYAWLYHLAAFYDGNKEKPRVLIPLRSYMDALEISKEDTETAVRAAGFIQQAHMLKSTLLEPLEEHITLNALDYFETRIDGSPFCLIDALKGVELGQERLVVGLLDERMYQRNHKLFKLFVPTGMKLEPISARDMFLEKYYVFDTEPIENKDLNIESSSAYIDGSNKRAVPGKVHLFPMKSAYIQQLKDVVLGGFEMSVAAGHLNAGVSFMVSGKKKTILCDYPPEAQVTLNKENMATTVIWPNVPDCRQYHVAAQWSKFAGTRDAFVFLPIDAGVDFADIKLRMRYILDAFPRFLKAQWVNQATAQVEDCGVVMVKAPQPIAAGHGKINYALDFGTSASIAAFNTGDPRDSDKVDFSNQVLLITPREREIDLANKLIFGVHGVKAPFPTVYYKDPFPTTVLFQGGHPYFELPGKIIDQDAEDNNKFFETNIKFDLGKGGDNAFIQQDYIKGIIHMLLIHAKKKGAGQVTLKVSYPISIKGIKEFKENIRAVVKAYGSGTSADGKTGAYPYGVELNEQGLEFITESESATRYFYSDKKPKECITLDIGGGSADLFTFSSQNNGNAMIASVVAGSRIFLLDLLRQRPSLFVAAMNEVKKKFPNIKLEQKWFESDTYTRIKKDSSAFYSSIECLLQFNMATQDGAVYNVGTEIGKVFRVPSGLLNTETNKNSIKQMRTIWLFQLAALFYYGGMMYRSTVGSPEAFKDKTIRFFLSGRGSQIINWLPAGGTEKVLKEMVRYALGAGDDVVIQLHQEPGSEKNESAIGMLKEPITDEGKVISEDSFTFDFVAGEAYIDKNGNNKSAMDLIRHICSLGRELKSQRMDEDFKAINSDLPVLTHFIDALNTSIKNSELNEEVYRIVLCGTPKEAAKMKGSASHEFYIDKATLADTIALLKKKIDNGTYAVDIPLFFYLVNVIRDDAILEWMGEE